MSVWAGTAVGCLSSQHSVIRTFSVFLVISMSNIVLLTSEVYKSHQELQQSVMLDVRF